MLPSLGCRLLPRSVCRVHSANLELDAARHSAFRVRDQHHQSPVERFEQEQVLLLVLGFQLKDTLHPLVEPAVHHLCMQEHIVNATEN